MPNSGQLLKGTALLTLGQVLSYGLSFVRNVILARMLTKADFGLAAIFGMTITMLELAGRMSFGQQIVQSKQGDSAEFQASAHGFQMALSFVGALLILALSLPLAHAMKVPELAWAFATLAVVPLGRGFEHLDYYRQQRHLNYLPVTLYEVVPQILMTAAAWPLAMWLGDFRVVVWLMVGKAMLGMAMTHFLAGQPYRWGWQKDYIRGMWLFGWPLLINGLLIFASQQADQVLIGAYFTLEELAPYALALMLASIPWAIFANVGSSLLLPVLSRAQEDLGQFLRLYRKCLGYISVTTVFVTVPLIIAGEQVVTLVYGVKYAGSGQILAILGAAGAIRFLRLAPTIASMSKADTVNQMYSNMVRCLSLPLAIIAVLLGAEILLVAGCALLAELAAAAVAMLRLSWRQQIPLKEMAGSSAYVIGFISTSLVLVASGAPNWSPWLAAGAVSTILILSLLLAIPVFPETARELHSKCKVAF